MNAQENTGNQPEKKFRAGAISATVWANHGHSKEGKENTYRTISISRGYKDKNDQWQNTTSFRINDLPRAALVLQKAYEYLATQSSDLSFQDTMTINEEVVM